VDGIEDQVFPVIGTTMPGNDLGTASDDHLMDIATDPDLLVNVPVSPVEFTPVSSL
jgi:hypothetical protein|tara:strand:+ start:791 stop:958 length:168 start_codon:yes stop_codon:yes gene_type:complete